MTALDTAPLDLTPFRAGRHWRWKDHEWRVVECNLQEIDEPRRRVDLDLRLSGAEPYSDRPPMDFPSDRSPFWVAGGTQAWRLITCEWSLYEVGAELRGRLVRCPDLDKPRCRWWRRSLQALRKRDRNA